MGSNKHFTILAPDVSRALHAATQRGDVVYYEAGMDIREGHKVVGVDLCRPLGAVSCDDRTGISRLLEQRVGDSDRRVILASPEELASPSVLPL